MGDPVMIRKPQPDEPAEVVRRRGMARLAGVSVGIAVLSVGGTAGVAVALPGAAHHTTGTASASASKKSSASPAKSAAPTKTSSPAAATSGGS
jgi:hypothetical protein